MQAGNRRWIVFFEWNQRAVRNLWIAAVGRLRVTAHPGIHVDDHRAPEVAHRKRRFRLLAIEVAFSFFRWKIPAEMLQTSEVVDADVRRNRRVVKSVRRHVDQRAGASPIFVGSVREENLRNNVLFGGDVEQSTGFAGERIGFGLVGKRKDVCWKENRRGWLRIP